MSENFTGRVPRVGHLRHRRIERLRREIALLSQMDDNLWRKAIFCGAAIIIGLAMLILTAAWKFQYFGLGETGIAAAALAIAALVWWMGRYMLWLPFILATLLFAIIFESLDGIDLFDGGEPDRKAERRAKITRAIDKRRALLARLEAT